MPFTDPDKKRAYDREYARKHRQKRTEQSKKSIQKIRNFRRNLLAQFPCISCGFDNPDAIEWHHVEQEPEFRIFSGGRGEEAFWDECLKCVPLCCNCHTLIHKEKLCLIPLRR